jgi:hypothetical protein
MLERMAVLPVSARTLAGEYVLAGSFLDGVQLLAPLLLLIAETFFPAPALDRVTGISWTTRSR